MSAKGGRSNTGQLILRKSGYVARFWAVVDGVRIRRCVPLGTSIRVVAKTKLRGILAGEIDIASAPKAETFREAAERIVTQQAAEGLKSHKDRKHRLKTFAYPEFGKLEVPNVKLVHIRAALDRALRAGMSRRSIMHLKTDLSTIFDELWRDEVIPENPVKKARVPKNAPVDERPRIVLTDDEFNAFMACPDVDPELRMMALTSRTLGGMRTSDLHAFDWAMVDTVSWFDAEVPRPKTHFKTRLALPDVLVPALKAWHQSQGSPACGAVFPARRGSRVGQHKVGKQSYAEKLRNALWAAGIVRPMPGYDPKHPDRVMSNPVGLDGETSA